MVRMGTISIPVWLAVLMIGAVFGIISYFYRRSVSRIEKIELWREGCMSKGQILTLVDHANICKKERDAVAVLIKQEFDDFSKLMDLKFQNLELVIKQNGGKKAE